MNVLLRGLRGLRRPFAWIVLTTGIVGFLLTFPLGLLASSGDGEFWVTLAGFALLALDGYDKVIEVEFDDEGNLVDEDEQ